MRIFPTSNNIQISIKEAKAGILDTSSRQSAVEYAEVVSVGEEVKMKIAKGDKVFVKSWSIDIISHEDNKYYFVNETSNGILAIVK
jgi:co-chaperonin GroES (HSP10)